MQALAGVVLINVGIRDRKLSRVTIVTEAGEACTKKCNIMNAQKKWHIIFTRQGAEKKVCEQLHKKKIEHLFSTCTWYNSNDDKGRQIVKPLFERKIFGLINDAEFNQVKDFDGVLQFVHWHNTPAILKPAEVDMIINFTSLNKNIRVEKINVKANGTMTTVFINNGNLTTVDSEDKNVIKAILPSMGISLVADIERKNADGLGVVRAKHVFPKIFTGSFK